MAWAPDYCTASELKAYLRITDTIDDVQIGIAITAASRALDKATGRQFGQLATAEQWQYTAFYDRRLSRWIVPVDDFDTLTGLVVSISGATVTDYQAGPRQAVAKGRVWTHLALGSAVMANTDDGGILVTAKWGWSTVPTAVKQACLLQTSRFLARRDSPYGVAGSPAEGSELRLLATVDPDVRVSLGHYVRAWGIA
jgi:hypothetical protein